MRNTEVARTGALARVRSVARRTGLLVLAIVLASPAGAEKAERLVAGSWKQVDALLVGELKGFTPREGVRLSKYGGLLSDWRAKATGFFRTEKRGDRWWLIDPQGCLFVSVGVCSVNLSTFAEGQLGKHFKGKDEWAERTAALLKSHGFNTLGCWSDDEAFRGTPHVMPYAPRWNFMGTYKNRRDPRNGEKGYPNRCMPVFDKEFEPFCSRHARQLAATKDDPWLLGHFSDNELPFRPNALSNYLELPKSDPGYRAARQWLDARRKDASKAPTKREEADFLEHLALRYYAIVNAAITTHDPNHLFLGSRVHGRTICPPVFRGSKPVDVVSVNYYHRWSAERERLARWVRLSGRPFLVSEWYAMGLDSPKTKVRGAGFRVRTDRGRGLFYQNLTLGLLEHPGCVGWHWFKYGGDGPGHHKGIVNRDFEPHRDLLALMKQLNEQVYPLAAHFRRPFRWPPTR